MPASAARTRSSTADTSSCKQHSEAALAHHPRCFIPVGYVRAITVSLQRGPCVLAECDLHLGGGEQRLLLRLFNSEFELRDPRRHLVEGSLGPLQGHLPRRSFATRRRRRRVGRLVVEARTRAQSNQAVALLLQRFEGPALCLNAELHVSCADQRAVRNAGRVRRGTIQTVISTFNFSCASRRCCSSAALFAALAWVSLICTERNRTTRKKTLSRNTSLVG